MMSFQNSDYRELATEVMGQLDGKVGFVGEAVELKFGRFDVIFGFDYEDGFQRWLLLVFEHGVRCSSDFEIEKLAEWI